jgi:hypothetical protein
VCHCNKVSHKSTLKEKGLILKKIELISLSIIQVQNHEDIETTLFYILKTKKDEKMMGLDCKWFL